MPEAIVITSGKGGVGKTTTTANIGTALAQLGHKVVVIDGDTGLRNLDVLMGLENRIVYTLLDYFDGRCKLKQALPCKPPSSCSPPSPSRQPQNGWKRPATPSKRVAGTSPTLSIEMLAKRPKPLAESLCHTMASGLSCSEAPKPLPNLQPTGISFRKPLMPVGFADK